MIPPSNSTAAQDPVDRLIWIDGRFVPWAEATVHVLSHGMQRGSVAFDYISIRETKRGPGIFRLVDHVERLEESCRLAGIPLRRTVEELVAATAETVRRNPGATSIKITATIPSIEVELVPQDDHVSVSIAAYDSVSDIAERNPGEMKRSNRLKLLIEGGAPARRENPIPAQAKVSANYASRLTAKWNARRAGYDDVILLDADGRIAEAPTCNVFIVDADGVLKTPPVDSIVRGVTRASFLEIAEAEGIPVSVEPITPEQLRAASEAFMSATSVGAWPVKQINDTVLGDGEPGPITQRLRTRYGRITSGQDPEFDHWIHYVDDLPD